MSMTKNGGKGKIIHIARSGYLFAFGAYLFFIHIHMSVLGRSIFNSTFNSTYVRFLYEIYLDFNQDSLFSFLFFFFFSLLLNSHFNITLLKRNEEEEDE